MTPAVLASACAFKHPKAIAAYREGWAGLQHGALRPDDRETIRVIVMGMLYNDVPPDVGLRAAAGYVDILALDRPEF